MSSAEKPHVDEVLPNEAWGILKDDPDAVLIDVRTSAEWAYVGLPDLDSLGKPVLLVEWQQLPGMTVNPWFVDEVMAGLGGHAPSKLLFLCRSGVRSFKAGVLVAAHLKGIGQSGTCLNVTHGFEGDLDEARHRGRKNGWKVAGLPWKQS